MTTSVMHALISGGRTKVSRIATFDWAMRAHGLSKVCYGANVITTDNSDWATNCPEYKVTAVQAMRVSQPSEWQKNYRRFTEEQLELLRQRKKAEKVA